ncbi:hypothetical protein J0X15_16400 [Roseibium sp. CAU 1637]|uniref:Uncharacterized protein n=1 Tax=Roseibium limicola TaxID=2816037 RepID=A0A939JAC7_9HYPH|nr:hypothetical protein [Roseibium limicola]MBO0346809.1 hypothetical protein [Roseibium limicola]
MRDRLAESGLAIETDNGLSDEGEPWFIFQRAGTDDVLVHIARIDQELVVVNAMTNQIYKGSNFRDVIDHMLEDAPLAMPRYREGSGKVVYHPSVVLTAFVAAAFLLADAMGDQAEAQAAQTTTVDSGSGSHADHALGLADGTLDGVDANTGGNFLMSLLTRRAGRDAAQNQSGTQSANQAGAPMPITQSQLNEVASTGSIVLISAAFFAVELVRSVENAHYAEAMVGRGLLSDTQADNAIDAAALTATDEATPISVGELESSAADGDGIPLTHGKTGVQASLDPRTNDGMAEELVTGNQPHQPAAGSDGDTQALARVVMLPDTAAYQPAVAKTEAITTQGNGQGIDDGTTATVVTLFASAAVNKALEELFATGDTLITTGSDGTSMVLLDSESTGTGTATSTDAEAGTGSTSLLSPSGPQASIGSQPTMATGADTGQTSTAADTLALPEPKPVVFTRAEDDYATLSHQADMSGPSRLLTFYDGFKDVVTFTAGHTVIQGFELGEDMIDLSNLFNQGAHVEIAISNHDVIMTEETGMSITLVGVLAPQPTVLDMAA